MPDYFDANRGYSRPVGRGHYHFMRMGDDEFRQFLGTVFRNYRAAIKPGASLYACHASSVQRDFENALEEAGFKSSCKVGASFVFIWLQVFATPPLDTLLRTAWKSSP
jgi:hypothetical protein